MPLPWCGCSVRDMDRKPSDLLRVGAQSSGEALSRTGTRMNRDQLSSRIRAVEKQCQQNPGNYEGQDALNVVIGPSCADLETRNT